MTILQSVGDRNDAERAQGWDEVGTEQRDSG